MKRPWIDIAGICTFTKTLERQRHGSDKTWVEKDFPLTTGYFLGWRTLSNGVMRTDSNFEGGYIEKYYDHQTTVQAALICYDVRKNPVYVPADNIKY